MVEDISVSTVEGADGLVEPEDTEEVDLFVELLSKPSIKALMAQYIEEAVSTKVTETIAAGNFVQAEPESVPLETTRSYLAQFSCARFPRLEVKEFEMANGKPDTMRSTGKDMKFRDGVFFAETDNQVELLQWKSLNDSHSTNGDVIGGNRDIRLIEDRRVFI